MRRGDHEIADLRVLFDDGQCGKDRREKAISAPGLHRRQCFIARLEPGYRRIIREAPGHLLARRTGIGSDQSAGNI